jgi:hypothetical protein
VNKEHIEDRKLDDSLIRAGADTVQGAREVPLSSTVEFSLPNHRSEDKESRDQEHGSATALHRKRDPKYVGKPLKERGSTLMMLFLIHLRSLGISLETVLTKSR